MTATSLIRSLSPDLQAVINEGGPLEVVLGTRRPVCGPRAGVIDRLSELRGADKIDEFTIETWPDEIVLSGRDERSPAAQMFEEYCEWAEANGASIMPPFERRTVTTLVGGCGEVLTLPIMCLAIYGEELLAVLPCTVDGRTWTIDGCLDVIDSS